MKKYKIEVREYAPGQNHHSSTDFKLIETIERSLRLEQCGNFSPIFCTYKGEEYLVVSDDGDTSDPFRAESTYKLHIEWAPPREWQLVWSPEGKKISVVKASTIRGAKRKAPVPYRKFQGEIYATPMT